jgi:MraZ protein
LSFLGQYEHTLDAKNRLTVPSKFRGALSDGVVLSKQLQTCIAIWPETGWERFTDHAMASRDPFNEELQDLSRFYHAGAFDARLDAAGRIMLPPTLIEHARLGKEVVLIGNLDRVEVWDRALWREKEASINQRAPELAQRLSGSGGGDTTS